MKLRSVVRDCLFLNWALPVEALPGPPAPLRYQLHSWQGRDYAFASALLFHHDAVRWRAMPLLRVGYPQLNIRLYVLDEDGVPSVLFHRELMPAWVAPGMRLVAGHPAASARLDFPRPSLDAEADSWTWRVERGDTLTVRARVHSPMVGEGPRIGSWEETVRFFQDRPRGYSVQGKALRRVDSRHPPVAGVWPLAVEITGGEALLRRLLPSAAPAGATSEPAWPRDGRPAFGGAVPAAEPAHAPDAAAAAASATVPSGRGTAAGTKGAAAAVLAAPSAAPAASPGSAPAAAREASAGGAAGASAADLAWPGLHSSWLCPEMPFSIAFDLVPKVQPVVQQLPHPAAGRVSSPALRVAPQSRADRPGQPARPAAADLAPLAAGSRVLASAA
jgi:hypothetical protein